MPRTATRRNDKHCSSACLSCRKKKKRCSGQQPVCELCSKHELQCIWATADDRRTARGRERERELGEENAQLKKQNASLTALVTMLTSGVPMTSGASFIDSYPAPTMLLAGGKDALPLLQFGAVDYSSYPPNTPLAGGDFSTPSTTRVVLQNADRSAPGNDTLAPAYAPQIDGIMPLHAAPPLFTGSAGLDDPRSHFY